jgi:beta-lactamase class A
MLTAHASPYSAAQEALRHLESGMEGHLGIFAINTANGHTMRYRADEIFTTGCTSKTIGVAAVLKASMSDPTLLSHQVRYSKRDVAYGSWSPVTAKHVAEGMTVQELCAASITVSDNTAMNLLLKFTGGTAGMTEFARSIGNLSFRQDNDWPREAYSGGKHNAYDASTPKAMIESLHKLVTGDFLAKPQRDLLTSWLIDTKTGAARIRSAVPEGWLVGNKTGTGGAYGTTNDIAVMWPPNHPPIFLGMR